MQYNSFIYSNKAVPVSSIAKVPVPAMRQSCLITNQILPSHRCGEVYQTASRIPFRGYKLDPKTHLVDRNRTTQRATRGKHFTKQIF